MNDGVFAQRFRGHEGPYHLHDSLDRPLIRMDHVSHGEWASDPVQPRACAGGDCRCKGRLVIMPHESHAGPDWMLTFRG